MDADTGRPLDGVVVELLSGGPSVVTDAGGRFLLDGLDAGAHTLEARRLGYAPRRVPVEVASGRRTTTRLALHPVALAVEPLEVRVAREGVRVDVRGAEAAGRRTVADLLRGVPGVTVSARGPGGPETVSIRAGGAGAVLVLLDGVPLNDPVTGEADLSTIPVATLASATVLPGARAARFGAGAEAGVVLLETRRAPAAPTLTLGAGSRGRWSGDAAAGGDAGGVRWSASAAHDEEHGRFGFALPASVGGLAGVRTNADVRRTSLTAALEGGGLSVRALHDRLDRGVPGVAWAPSPAARQEDARSQLSLSWSDGGARATREAAAWAVRRDARLRDASPPVGLPYDDTLSVEAFGARADARRRLLPTLEATLGGRLDAQRVTSDALSAPGGRARTDAAVHGGLAAGPFRVPGAPSLSAAARLHRDGRTAAWHASHDVAVSASAGPLALQLAHRSAWTPPDLADLFFREGVGVRPNPELRPERVPSEVEATLSATATGAGWTLRGGVSLYRADVEDMVVWAPDFRFVWSPSNVDVRRRGMDAWARLALDRGLPGTLTLDAGGSRARATYADADDPDLQLAYRPRHTASVAASWRGAAGALALEGRYTGLRYPVPARVNALPGFWTWDATALRPWRVGAWTVETRLHLERALGATDALIFGYPHPGRTLALEVAVQAPTTHPIP